MCRYYATWLIGVFTATGMIRLQYIESDEFMEKSKDEMSLAIIWLGVKAEEYSIKFY